MEMTEDKREVGRPTLYNDDVIAVIFSRLADGESLRQICLEEGMPNKVTFFNWMHRYPELHERYAKAREMQADSLFEEVLEVGRADPGTAKTFDEDNNLIGERVDAAEVQHRKLKIDTLKWAAGKLRPKKYGDTATLQADVTHKHYVAMIPPRTTNDPVEWAKKVHAERVRTGEIPPDIEPEDPVERPPPPGLPQRVNGT